MPKAAAPGQIDIPGVGPFSASAVPDPFDDRDLIYRPMLDLLPTTIDQRQGRRPRHVYLQEGESCTGHAVAAVINHVLSATTPGTRVSPYMLYHLARRYDEFPGTADAGSSLRGAFKGWFHHGAAAESSWPSLDTPSAPDVDDPDNLLAWRERPLGAFYRVNAFRLDDVQSAINELKAIAVSSVIHEGWERPVVRRKGRRTVHVIARRTGDRIRGGHAYCLVGYNEIGFLVQNSWGPGWGDGGFATLPYEDWLDSAYDAWVARPGVPQTPFWSGRSRTAIGTGGELVTATAPDLGRLAYHVVNTGNDGGLSTSGKFVSSPEQLDRMIEHMGEWHRYFLRNDRASERQVVLWAHGGGVAEKSGLQIASRQLNWWLNNGVYPVSLVWETGPLETVKGAVEDLIRGILPAGGFQFDVMEQVDRLVEGRCRQWLRWAWQEMKENAERASRGHPDATSTPGARLLIERLRAYASTNSGLRIHLAGHSAGSVYQAAMLDAFKDAGLDVQTLTWLAPAISVAKFRDRVLPHLGVQGTVERFTCFNLSDALELADAVEPVYHKSAVYLVARGFEEDLGGRVAEVPILGLEKYWQESFAGGRSLRDEVSDRGGELIVARSAAPAHSRTNARRHGDFDEDQPTMTSVLMRILGVTRTPRKYEYQSNAKLLDPESVPWPRRGGAMAPVRGAPVIAAGVPAPVLRMAAGPAAAAADQVASRSGSPILDMIDATGWKAGDE